MLHRIFITLKKRGSDFLVGSSLSEVRWILASLDYNRLFPLVDATSAIHGCHLVILPLMAIIPTRQVKRREATVWYGSILARFGQSFEMCFSSSCGLELRSELCAVSYVGIIIFRAAAVLSLCV